MAEKVFDVLLAAAEDEDDQAETPAPSPIEEVSLKEAQTVELVSCDTDEYRKNSCPPVEVMV